MHTKSMKKNMSPRMSFSSETWIQIYKANGKMVL